MCVRVKKRKKNLEEFLISFENQYIKEQTIKCNNRISHFEISGKKLNNINAFIPIETIPQKCYTLRKTVLSFVRIQVQYRRSVKNVTFSCTNHDLFLKKEHFFFQIKNIFDSKKGTSLAPLRYWT
jgi:hypothetical protein